MGISEALAAKSQDLRFSHPVPYPQLMGPSFPACPQTEEGIANIIGREFAASGQAGCGKLNAAVGAEHLTANVGGVDFELLPATASNNHGPSVRRGLRANY
jgi:hypothetical protein